METEPASGALQHVCPGSHANHAVIKSMNGLNSESGPICCFCFSPQICLFLQAEHLDVKDVAAEKIQHVFRIFQTLLKVCFLILRSIIIICDLHKHQTHSSLNRYFCHGCRRFSPQNWDDELQAALHCVASGKRITLLELFIRLELGSDLV